MEKEKCGKNSNWKKINWKERSSILNYHRLKNIASIIAKNSHIFHRGWASQLQVIRSSEKIFSLKLCIKNFTNLIIFLKTKSWVLYIFFYCSTVWFELSYRFFRFSWLKYTNYRTAFWAFFRYKKTTNYRSVLIKYAIWGGGRKKRYENMHN